MQRSIVIPKGTICPEKTTIVRIPITTPANTTPLIVVNRQSSSYKPSDTQDVSLQSRAPMRPPEMYQPQGRMESPRNQTYYGQNGSNFNQTRRGSNSNTNNTRRSNSLPNTSNMVAYCTDKYPEPDNNVVECECVVDSDPIDTSDSDQPPCFCDAYALCKADANESASPYIPCPSNTSQQSSSRRNSNSTYNRSNVTNSRGSPMNSTYNNQSNVKRSSEYESRNATYWPSNNESPNWTGISSTNRSSCECNGDADPIDIADNDESECMCSPYAPCQSAQDTSQYIDCPSNSFQGNNTSYGRGPAGGLPSETFNRTPVNGSSCECNNDAVEDSYADEDDGMNCFCSPQAPCKYDENQYNDFQNMTQANSNFGYPDSTFSSDNGEANCLCSSQSPCKVANDQYSGYSPQANSTFATPQRQPPNSTFAGSFSRDQSQRQMYSAGPANDSFRQICECNGNNNTGRQQDSQYQQYVASSSTRGGANNGGCPDYSPCPLNSQGEQDNTIICPTYLDSINEEDEDAGDNQPNQNMTIIHVSSRTYSRMDDGPVQGKSFTFDDPEGQGVSSMVFNQLAKSILEDPPEDDLEETFPTTCTDKPEFLYSNFDGQQQDKKCKC